MAGLVIAIMMQVVKKVRKGQGVILIETMKMENELTAPMDGKVQEISVKVGDTTEAGQKLIEIERDT